MNTYYKNDNGNFIATTISVDDAIAAIVQSAVTNAVNKANDIIINAVINRVECAVGETNIKGMVDSYLSSASLSDSIDDALSKAIDNYDYDGVIDNTLDSIDIDEMVTEKVTDHLDSCSIQVRIN
jgi:benzoyl-CoA reductase/2-hydroxyglutaryl-CoA dehydratase subunit BcrC/BadD/HgdB